MAYGMCVCSIYITFSHTLSLVHQDMATQFPDCNFIGIEFSAQSTLVPQMLTLPNVRTETTFGQLDQYLSLESASVDLCHMRAQGLEFDQRNWMHLLSEAYRVLKPGGLLQIVDGHFAVCICRASHKIPRSLNDHVVFYHC